MSVCEILYYSSTLSNVASINLLCKWLMTDLIWPSVEWDVGGQGEAIHSGYRQRSSSWAYFIKTTKSGKGVSFSLLSAFEHSLIMHVAHDRQLFYLCTMRSWIYLNTFN